MTAAVLTTQEVAATLRISEATVYRLIKQRKIPAMRVGGQYRILKDALEKRLTPPAAESADAA